MVQAGTILKVCDRTGVTLVQCIKVFGASKKRIAYLGDVILVSVKKFSFRKVQHGKAKKKRKFPKGVLQRGLVVRAKVNYKRMNGLFIKFNENTVVLVNKKVVPISSRTFGPIMRELCMKWPSLGCITRFVI